MSTLGLRPELFEFDLEQPTGSCRCQHGGVQEAALSTEMEDENLFLKSMSHEWEQDELSELLETEFDEEAWEGEASRNSPALIRWVQQSLNKVLGLRLAADGKLGPQTRSAIRSFQQKQGLVADGIVGPETFRALKKASSGGGQRVLTAIQNRSGCPIKTQQEIAWERSNPRGRTELIYRDGRPVLILWNFAVGRSQLKAEHIRELQRLGIPSFLDVLVVEGHSSCTGQKSRKLKIAEDRAKAVKRVLLTIGVRSHQIDSFGSGDSIPWVSNTTPENMAKNRRVEISGGAIG